MSVSILVKICMDCSVILRQNQPLLNEKYERSFSLFWHVYCSEFRLGGDFMCAILVIRIFEREREWDHYSPSRTKVGLKPLVGPAMHREKNSSSTAINFRGEMERYHRKRKKGVREKENTRNLLTSRAHRDGRPSGSNSGFVGDR